MSRHLRKTRLRNTRQLWGGKFMGHLQTPSHELSPDKMSIKNSEKMVLARAPKSLHAFAKFQRQIIKFGILQKLQHVRQKLESLIQNHGALIAV